MIPEANASYRALGVITRVWGELSPIEANESGDWIQNRRLDWKRIM
jgi:hypothetical protein